MKQAMKGFRRITTWAVVFGLALLLGCGGDKDGEGNGDGDKGRQVNTDLKGEVSINGSSTVAPISIEASSRFKKTFPNVNVTVGSVGTGDGFKSFAAGETAISDASRPIKAKELDLCKDNGIEFIELPVAYDGITVIVHKEMPLEQVTVEQLKTIFSAETAPEKWSDVDPSWPDEKISIFAPGDESGTYDYFVEAVLGKGGKVREYSTNADDNQLVNSISGNKGSLGFVGASYYFGNKDSLKAVKVVNPETGTAVMPSPETIESGEYSPLSRPLFIYVNAEKLKQPEVRTFVEDYIGNAAEIATAAKSVPLPAELYQRAEEHLKKKLTGTHFLTAEGESREGKLLEVYKAENLSKD